MLLRADPFRELDRWTRTLLDTPEPAYMPMDAYRHGDVFTLEFDLPGIDPDSIEVTVERNELRVVAERSPQWPEGAQVLVNERPRGKVTRRMFLADNLDTDHLTAEYDDGVLTVRLPLHEGAKARRIQVGHGDRAKAIEVGT
jgi:HSP20 family protein